MRAASGTLHCRTRSLDMSRRCADLWLQSPLHPGGWPPASAINPSTIASGDWLASRVYAVGPMANWRAACDAKGIASILQG